MNEKLRGFMSTMESDYRVLVTGFVPFGGHATNISQTVASAMEGRRPTLCPWTGEKRSVMVEVDILTVDEAGAQRTANRLRSGAHWDAILHVGLCESCEVPRIERLASDRLNMRLPDNAGRQVIDSNIDGAGHRGCWVDPTVWSADLFPCNYTLSMDAGAYLCNETYHATAKALCELPTSTALPTPCLFLHLPGEMNISTETAIAFTDATLAYLLRPFPSVSVQVFAAAIAVKGRYVITKRSMTEADAGLWEFPGGKSEPGEDWRQAIGREIEEELGIRVVPNHLLGSWHRTRGTASFAIHLVACGLEDENAQLDLRVHDAFRWISLTDDDPGSWAGRDGEMAAFLRTAFKSTS
jgi:mutator protein MutT